MSVPTSKALLTATDYQVRLISSLHIRLIPCQEDHIHSSWSNSSSSDFTLFKYISITEWRWAEGKKTASESKGTNSKIHPQHNRRNTNPMEKTHKKLTNISGSSVTWLCKGSAFQEWIQSLAFSYTTIRRLCPIIKCVNPTLVIAKIWGKKWTHFKIHLLLKLLGKDMYGQLSDN